MGLAQFDNLTRDSYQGYMLLKYERRASRIWNGLGMGSQISVENAVGSKVEQRELDRSTSGWKYKVVLCYAIGEHE